MHFAFRSSICCTTWTNIMYKMSTLASPCSDTDFGCIILDEVMMIRAYHNVLFYVQRQRKSNDTTSA